jgi:hypothetical protein
MEVTLRRGKHAQVLTRQDAGWAREAVRKLEKKILSLLPGIKPQFLD